VQHAVLQPRTPTTFSIDAPGIHVPSHLGWTVESISNLYHAGTPGSIPAAAGEIEGGMLYNTAFWEVDSSPPSNAGGWGFRLFAVPEPSSTLLSAVAIVGYSSRRRRPTSHNRV